MLRPFEFLAASNHMIVHRIKRSFFEFLVKFLPVCFFLVSAKKCFKSCFFILKYKMGNNNTNIKEFVKNFKPFCRKFKKELPKMDRPPYPGPNGEEIFNTVSKDAWKLGLST